MNEFLPEGMTPLPGPLKNGCARCGSDVHIYERDLSINDMGEMICGNCTRKMRPKGLDPRAILRNFRWRHGHDPMDVEADTNSPVEYVTLEQTTAPALSERSQLEGKGGPETPFPCETCGTKLRAVADRTAMDILAPTGYHPSPGTLPPSDRIVILVCPHDSPTARHKYMQIRASMLKEAMARA